MADEGDGDGGFAARRKSNKANKVKPPEMVEPGAHQQQFFDLSESGRFVDGELIISPTGLVVNASPGVPASESARFELSEKDFECLEIVGKGASSTVRKALWKKTQEILALKAISVFDQDLRKQLLNEIKHLFASRCPQLVHFYGAFYHEGAISIALEYATGGALSDMLELHKGGMDEQMLAYIMHQILKGLRFMHRNQRMVHRDLKPSNLLFDHTGRVVLTDFGVSRALETEAKCESFVGTYHYFSPERFLGQQYSYPSDIWGVGLIAVECVMGEYPYSHVKGYWELLHCAVNDPPPVILDGKASPQLADFVRRCMVKEPARRATANELLEHDFILQHCGKHCGAPKSHRSARIAEWVSSARTVFSTTTPPESCAAVGHQFAVFYFAYLSTNRRMLTSLYTDSSKLSVNEDSYVGRKKIMDALMMMTASLQLDTDIEWPSVTEYRGEGQVTVIVEGSTSDGSTFVCKFFLQVTPSNHSYTITTQTLRILD